MSRIPEEFLTHEVVIDPFTGRAAAGPVFGDQIVARCHYSRKRHLVRGVDNREIKSGLQVYLAPEMAGRVPLDSRVTVDDRTATVVEVREHIHPDLPTPDHVHLLCA